MNTPSREQLKRAIAIPERIETLTEELNTLLGSRSASSAPVLCFLLGIQRVLR
jgi:hypothetical protein